MIPCKLARKRNPPRRQKKDVLRTGWRMEALGEGDYYGFTLDGDGRFLLKDFTVTHNTASAIVNKFHGVFRNEAGTLREGWTGSELEARAVAFEALYRRETAPVMARLEVLREQRERLKAELERALQRRLIGDIEFEGLTGPQRDRRLAELKTEAEEKRTRNSPDCKRKRRTVTRG